MELSKAREATSQGAAEGSQRVSFDRNRLPAQPMRDVRRLDTPVTHYDYRHQLEEATPVQTIGAPASAPNVVIVLLDDMGFGASSAYGGPVSMPTAEALKKAGLTFSQFHVNAMCSPTRQSLMTGRNHHSVGMAVTSEMATNFPGYSGVRPASAGTLARVLNGNGYNTAAFGKYHHTPQHEVSPVGPFARWPTGEGFEKFYGFLSCEMNHWYPQLYEGTTPVDPTVGEDDYHLTEDLVDQAIAYVRSQQTLAPGRPFFTFLSLGATHAPYHVPKQWREKYRGAFDLGYNVARERTLENQVRLGLVPAGTDLPPWPEDVPHWHDLSPEEQRVSAAFMETYAGFAEHADFHVGRLVQALEALNVMENTVFLYMLGDNGASGEGGIHGASAEHIVGHGYEESIDDLLAVVDRLGDESTYPVYPVGWALAMNTPYQWTKMVASHLGGTRDGLIVRWDAGIAHPGELRHQWHHVIDVFPTILDVAGLPAPVSIDGVDQMPLHGVSMAYLLDHAEEPGRRRTQYFELAGNRAIYHEGWTAVTRHGTPWANVGWKDREFSQDEWELYELGTDWSQAHDVAAEHPRMLEELKQLFVIEASKYHVFPLDDRVSERHNPLVAHREGLLGGRRSVTYPGGTSRLLEEVVLNTKNCSHSVVASIESALAEAPSGVIAAQGGSFGGWALFVVDGTLHYAYNLHGLTMTTIAGGSVPSGPSVVAAHVEYDGGGVGKGAGVRLVIDGAVVAHGRLDATTAYYFGFDETFNVGHDPGAPVSVMYPAVRNRFTGVVKDVTLSLDGEPSLPTAAEWLHTLFAHK
jgi:arylsulfatase A-like enzyme